MTSLRYSNDRVDSNDLKRCIKQALPFPAIAALVLFIMHSVPLISFVLSREFRSQRAKLEIISFFGEPFLNSSLIQFGMVCCGMVTAAVLFMFLFKKNSVNVYLSMGITRTRLYFNRIASGVSLIFLASFIPMTVNLIVNLFCFGANAHLFQVYFYMLLAYFILGLAGFAVASFTATVSGSFIELVITSILFSIIPIMIKNELKTLKYGLLNGFTDNGAEIAWNITDVLSPFTIIKDLEKNIKIDEVLYNPINQLGVQLTKKVPESLMLDSGLMIPIFTWIIIAAVLLALGYFLINRRKMEHSNSFGKFYISSAINGTAVFCAAMLLLNTINTDLYTSGDGPMRVFRQNITVFLIITIIGTLIVYFIGQLIIKRKLKAAVKMLPVYAVLAALSVAMILCFRTGYFGSYNKLPAQTQIKSVAMDINDERNLFGYGCYSIAAQHSPEKAYTSSNADDIKLAEKYFELIRDQKYSDNFDQRITFCFELKNGSYLTRSFHVYTRELFDSYVRDVYASNFFKGYMKYLMLEDPYPMSEENDSEVNYYNTFGARVYYGPEDENSKGRYKALDWYCLGSSLVIDGYNRDSNTVGLEPVEFKDELLKALYEDLTKLSYDEVYKNNARPVAVLTSDFCALPYATDKLFSTVYGDMVTEAEAKERENGDRSLYKKNSAAYASPAIYIYPQMTNTLNVLSAHGYELPEYPAKIKYAYVTQSSEGLLKAIDALRTKLSETNKDYYYYSDDVNSPYLNTFRFCNDFDSILYNDFYSFENPNYSDTYEGTLNKVFADIGKPLTKIEDTAKSQAINEKAVPFYDTYGDDGRYVFFIWDDNAMTSSYVPSANADVLK